MDTNKIYQGDCIEVMKQMPENSVGAIVTDPPAGISFMQESWDTFDHNMFGIEGQKGDNDLKVKKNFKILPRYNNSDLIGFQDFIYKVFTEAIRVLKPGGYALVWAIPRTSHHTTMGLERAGFEIRDKIFHIFGSGFPKSQNIGMMIDKKKGLERKKVGRSPNSRENSTKDDTLYKSGTVGKTFYITEPASEEARQWDGWGTALKPAVEEWILVRKPLSEDTVVKNIAKHGVGGINIDVSRIKYQGEEDKESARFGIQTDLKGNAYGKNRPSDGNVLAKNVLSSDTGRFPANVILECICDELIVNGEPLQVKKPDVVAGGIWKPSEGKPAGPMYEGGVVLHTNPQCPCYMLDVQSGLLTSGYMSPALHQRNETQGEYQSPAGIYGKFNNQYLLETYGDTGGASRFFKQVRWNDGEDLCGNISERKKVVGILNGVIQAIEQFTENVEQFLCGNNIMENFQKDTKSIIEILINQMIELKTYNVYPEKHINIYMQDCERTIKLLMELNIEDAKNVESIRPLIIFGRELKEHTEDIVKNVLGRNWESGEEKTEKNIMNICRSITKNTEKEGKRFFYQAKAAQNEKWFYCKVCEKAFCSDTKEQHIHQDKCETKSYTKNRRCLKCGKQEVSGSPCKCDVPEWEVIERPIANSSVISPFLIGIASLTTA